MTFSSTAAIYLLHGFRVLVNFIDGDGVAAAPEKSREVVRQEKCGFVDFAAGAAEWNSEIDFSLVKYPAWKTSLLELLS